MFQINIQQYNPSGAHQQTLHLNHKPVAEINAKVGGEEEVEKSAQRPFNVQAITYV